jgi:hypothetical protein
MRKSIFLWDETVWSRISGPSTEILYDVIADSRISVIYTETLCDEKHRVNILLETAWNICTIQNNEVHSSLNAQIIFVG